PVQPFDLDNRVKLEYYRLEKTYEGAIELESKPGSWKPTQPKRAGGQTEIEMKEKKLRIEDALNATKAAVEEGIVPGGGTAYINTISTVAALCDTTEGDEKIGVKLVLKALEAPLAQIAANAGFEGAVVVDKVKNSEKGVGFDAYNEVYVDMMAEGIVDPVKVTRSALQNAASIASTVLTTEAVVANKPEPEVAAPAAGGMGGMY
ncbi:MAG: hypothetical protein IIX18_01165, partial [Clostridia bacterium]|nr:hypothetical protein [Clostridia bacterium]